MTIAEKVAYLKGLADGCNKNSESGEGKLLTAIIDTLEDIAYELEEINENIEDIDEAVDSVSEDLSDVEELLFGDDDDDDDDDDFDCCDDDECDCGCSDGDDDCDCGGCCDGEMTYEVDCPACGGEIVLQEADLVNGAIKCPSCGEQLDFEYGEDDDTEE